MKKKFLICFLSIILSNADGQIIDPHGEHHEEPSYLKEELFCNHSNYKEFIFDPDKMLELRDQGKTCQLGGLKFVDEDFRGAVLVGVNFRGSEFVFVKFNGANLFDADMTNTVHTGSYFNDDAGVKTTLEKTNFTDARLIFANFKNANMRDAIFVKVSFNVKEMSGADVTGADFSNVLLLNSEIDYDSIIGLDQIICAENSTRSCRVFQDCSRPDNPYC